MYVDTMLGSAARGSPGIEELRWLAPVRPGDTLSGRLTVLEATPSATRPDRGTIRIRGEMVNQDGVIGDVDDLARPLRAAPGMTGCCARHGQEEFFGEKTAANDARKYRRKGPDPMARSLARRAAARGVEGASVLEIGGGVGQVALELLKEGAASAEVVELLPAYEPYVRSLASEAGVAERISFRTADLVAEPTSAAPVDVVVMNKVVCCTPDGVALAGHRRRHWPVARSCSASRVRSGGPGPASGR